MWGYHPTPPLSPWAPSQTPTRHSKEAGSVAHGGGGGVPSEALHFLAISTDSPRYCAQQDRHTWFLRPSSHDPSCRHDAVLRLSPRAYDRDCIAQCRRWVSCVPRNSCKCFFWGGAGGAPFTRCPRTPQGRPRAPGGARHRAGNRSVNSQPRTGQSTSYGDVKSSYGGASVFFGGGVL